MKDEPIAQFIQIVIYSRKLVVDFVYVFGGINKMNCLNECERYNVQTNTWEEIPSLVLFQ